MRRLAARCAGRSLAVLLLSTSAIAPAATLTIVNLDAAGEGLNDPTVVAPVGGNTGTTLGEQRLIALENAADLWGAALVSPVDIEVGASFAALACSATSATLGLGGPNTMHRDFVGAPLPATWYPAALANSLAGVDLEPGVPDIDVIFNLRLDDDAACAFPQTFYYGVDGGAPDGTINFVTVALHELAHGLGFLTGVNLMTGAKLLGFDDTFMLNLEDHDTGLVFPAMTDAERAAAITNTGNLHWVGPAVVANSGGLSAGRHASGHVEMFAPAVVSSSSVSHFSDALSPDELMEPAYLDVMHDLALTVHLMNDLSWTTGTAPTTSTSTSTTTTTSTSTTTTTLLPTCAAAPVEGCVLPAKAVVLVKETQPGKEKAKVVLKRLAATVAQSDFGDPVDGGTNYAVCLYDDGNGLVATLALARAGDLCGTSPRPCWKALSTTGYKYADKLAESDGLLKLVLKGGAAGSGKVVIKGGNNAAKGLVALPTGITPLLQGTAHATVQLVGTDGECFGVTTERVKRADGTVFIGLTP